MSTPNKKSAQAKYRSTRRGLGLGVAAVEGLDIDSSAFGVQEPDVADDLAADRVGFFDPGVVAHQLDPGLFSVAN